ncbi:hypothetical protein C451_19883 [Halococcus thailandensis JCM 13552]|jgi:hypothetical protein|uniref:2TM domain-containing protein n=1 Tax=Halococcus thailandensis JCM 13552 TaxID=1227457 RepID=M0MWN9_9EURY|nr:hypothetical protein C451_19883 [Halococcus thailandensis JCM 13552]
MARTQWQRRRAVASTVHQLRTIVWIVLFTFVGLDFILGGVFPVWMVLNASLFTILEGCIRVFSHVQSRLLR